MSNAIAATKETSLANWTDQEKALLKAAQNELGTKRGVFIPQLKLSGKGTKSKIKEGHFFLVVPTEEDGEKKIKEIDIGENPEVVILKRLYAYSRYSKGKDKLLNFTNEFEGFTEDNRVVLVNTVESSAFIEFDGNYPTFKKQMCGSKEYPDAKYYDADEARSMLKFTNVLYIYFEHPDTEKRVFRMFVSNSSATGIPAGKDHGDFKHPESTSLIAFLDNMKKTEPDVCFAAECRLGCELKQGGIPFYIITFESLGAVSDMKPFLRLWFKLNQALTMRFKNEILSIPSVPSEDGTAMDVIDIDTSDLPDL